MAGRRVEHFRPPWGGGVGFWGGAIVHPLAPKAPGPEPLSRKIGGLAGTRVQN